MTELKKCFVCLNLLPLDCFHANNHAHDGKQHICRDCRAKRRLTKLYGTTTPDTGSILTELVGVAEREKRLSRLAMRDGVTTIEILDKPYGKKG